MQPHELLRDALAQVIATERREWRREREIMESEHRAALADLRAQMAERVSASEAAALDRVDRAVAARLSVLRDGRDGVDGKDGRDGRDGANGQDGAPGRDGVDGQDGASGMDGASGRDGDPGPAGRDGAPGTDGLAGQDGSPGPMGIDGRDGRDGVDGRSMVIRGTWVEGQRYERLDVVVLNGASFVARADEPGPCPGGGWQMIAAQGKRGAPGDRGDPGRQGDPGLPGPPVVALDVDREGLLTLTNGDGSATTLDLYPLLSRVARVSA